MFAYESVEDVAEVDYYSILQVEKTFLIVL